MVDRERLSDILNISVRLRANRCCGSLKKTTKPAVRNKLMPARLPFVNASNLILEQMTNYWVARCVARYDRNDYGGLNRREVISTSPLANLRSHPRQDKRET